MGVRALLDNDGEGEATLAGAGAGLGRGSDMPSTPVYAHTVNETRRRSKQAFSAQVRTTRFESDTEWVQSGSREQIVAQIGFGSGLRNLFGANVRPRGSQPT